MDRNKECPGCGIKKALKSKNIVVTENLMKEGNRPVQVTTILSRINGNWLVAEVNVDITERKQVEERINQREKSKTLDQTFQFIGMLTPDGKIIEGIKQPCNLPE